MELPYSVKHREVSNGVKSALEFGQKGADRSGERGQITFHDEYI